MVFLPDRGGQMTLQVAANGGPGGYSWKLSPTAAKIAIRPGPHTLAGPDGRTQIRVLSLRVPGGSLVAGTSLDQVYETIVRVELIVILGSIAVVLLIGLGVFAVLRRGLRPIEAMAAQADRITAGDLTDRVTPHHPGSEVGRLGTALNGMLARIEAAVQEREASQQQMRRFFADASHELRTPLASLRANAELYQQGALSSPDEVDEVMDRIVLETRRMGRLVDDMLRLARLGQHPGQSSRAGRPDRRGHRVRGAGADRRPRADLAGPDRRRPGHGRRRGTAAPRRRQPAHERARAHPRRHRGHDQPPAKPAVTSPSRSATTAPAFRRTSCRTSSSASTAPEPVPAMPGARAPPASGSPSPPRSPPRTAAPRTPRPPPRAACGSR